jgi:8-oxo-dGTP pyrophosphatase MutT (NUDIX family)
VTGHPTLAALRSALARRPAPGPPDAPGGRPAAVLACLHDEAVLLVRRAVHERDPWSGHIGLPGGRHEPGDRTLLDTALRETREELGFDAEAAGEVLGALGEHAGRGRGVRGIRIAAYVAALRERPAMALSDEIQEAIWVPLAELSPTRVEIPELAVPMPAYRLRGAQGDVIVWGITFAILELLRAVV